MSPLPLLDGVKADATVSACGAYRYALTREWFPKRGKGDVLWVMLNPSVADADVDDPTLRRVQHFSKAWGYDGAFVVNLFAVRSSTPDVLRTHPDPIGPANDDTLEALFSAGGIGLVVAAWGAHGKRRNRDYQVRLMAKRAGRSLHVLGFTKDRHPKHPLARGKERIPDDAQPIEWVA